ncbi:MAG: hypothetical protein AAGE52_21550 [Myxococcota bacterium]
MRERFQLVLMVCAAACAPVEDPSSITQATIWGEDDRQDWREVDGELQALGRRSVGVLVSRFNIGRTSTPDNAVLLTSTRAERDFCDDAPYLCQPRVGFCSGTLVDGNLFATAGHCLGIPTPNGEATAEEFAEIRERAQRWCDNTAIVFNWREEEGTRPGPLPPGETGGEVAPIVTERDVYYCHEVLVHQFARLGRLNVATANSSDVALLTLKRSRDGAAPEAVVEPYGAAPVPADPRSAPSIAAGTTGYGIGFPNGLPMKFKTSPLREVTPLWAFSTLDGIGGDSGGGIFVRMGGALTHIGVWSQSARRCPAGTSLDGHYCRRESGCLVETQGAENNLSRTDHSLIYRAVDSLCGARPWPGSGTPPPPVLNLHGGPYPSYLCGTAGPVASSPFVPSPPPVDPPPSTEEPPATAAGCATSSGSAGALTFLALLFFLRSFRKRGWLLALALGCGSSGSDEVDASGTDAAVVDVGSQHDAAIDASTPGSEESFEHIVSFIRLPRSEDALGVDLDGDGNVDAALGRVVSLFDDLGISLRAPLGQSIASGRLQLLVKTELSGGRASVEVYPGSGGPLNPAGGGIYQIAPGAPVDEFFGGRDEDAWQVSAERFVMRIPLLEEGPVIELPLQRVTLAGQANDFELEASLGGAVATRDLRAGLFNPVAELLRIMIEGDRGCPAGCESMSLTLVLAMLDANEDGRVSVEELEGFEPLQTRLTPDIDLDGDGTLDALSVGVELEGVSASFSAAEEATAFKSSPLCFDPCSEITECGACTRSDGCGWCPGEGCQGRGAASECTSGWTTVQSRCTACEGYEGCDECVRDGFCGWCPSLGCINDRSPDAASCEGYDSLSCR